MAKKTYTVAGPFPVFDHPPGETFSEEIPPEQEAALLANGNLVLGEAKDTAAEKAAKVPCPACVEQELKQPPKFDDVAKLRKHYAERHAGLEPPQSLPDATQKEE